MQFGAGILAFALAAVVLAPSASAADVSVRGRNPHVRGLDGRLVRTFDRPIFVQVDQFADFGHKQVATAPPLSIEVKGDVEIVPLANGGLRIKFIDE